MTFKELQGKLLTEKDPNKIKEIFIEFAKDPNTTIEDMQKVNELTKRIR